MSLSTDVNFQNDLQYSINPRLISRIRSDPTMSQEFFRHFQTKAVFSQ
jgi:hypothetical protein